MSKKLDTLFVFKPWNTIHIEVFIKDSEDSLITVFIYYENNNINKTDREALGYLYYILNYNTWTVRYKMGLLRFFWVSDVE